jgi:hypothetical protein
VVEDACRTYHVNQSYLKEKREKKLTTQGGVAVIMIL